MDLYIQVENGQPIGHPAYGLNLIQAFTLIPANWEKFERKQSPTLNIYQKLESDASRYEKINGVWQDVWTVLDFSEEEKTTMQQKVKDEWASRSQAANWSAWTFDEDTCSFIPPIPRPEPVEGKIVFWCGAENNWKETPAYPEDGKQYKFDFFAWTWVEKTVSQ